MFFEKPPQRPDWSAAMKHLRRDPVLRPIVRKVGPCTLAPREDHFIALCQSIYAQQISTKIATTLFGRFAEKFPRKKPTPGRVVAALSGAWTDEVVRHCGLSRQKREYVLDLATHFAGRKIDTRKLLRMPDEAVIESLTKVRGVGRWTAEMFLIFVMNRPDVLPVDDLGLREGVKKLYCMSERPKPKEMIEFGEKWRPYRSIATWYIWRGT